MKGFYYYWVEVGVDTLEFFPIEYGSYFMVEIIMSLTSEKICDCCLVSAYFVLQVQFNKYVMCQTLFGVGKKIETDAIVKKKTSKLCIT